MAAPTNHTHHLIIQVQLVGQLSKHGVDGPYQPHPPPYWRVSSASEEMAAPTSHTQMNKNGGIPIVDQGKK
jgi:hypothetical protein